MILLQIMGMFTLLVDGAICFWSKINCMKKIEVALVQQWERGNGRSQQTDVPCKATPTSPLHWRSHCQDGCLSSRPAGLDPVHAANTISLNPTSKWIFRPWHNSSSSLPALLTTSFSVSLLLFSLCGTFGGWCGCLIFQISMSEAGFRRLFHWAGRLGLLPVGLSCWQPLVVPFLGLSWIVLSWVSDAWNIVTKLCTNTAKT